MLFRSDAKDVVRDIEAHNGLIIELYNNKFEFSHLSIQEYLSAKYILSIPISRKHYELFNKYTAPLAIATVLSPRPEEWFSALFLYHIDEIRLQYQIDSNKIFEYLNRLIVEKVHFSKSTVELGFAMIYLFFKYSKTKALSKLIEFSETRFVKESIHLGSQYYNIERYAGQFHFKINSKIISDMHIKYPEEGVVNIRYIENLIS